MSRNFCEKVRSHPDKNWMQIYLYIRSVDTILNKFITIITNLYTPRFPGLLNNGLCRGTAAGDITPPTITLDVMGLTRGTVAPGPRKLIKNLNQIDCLIARLSTEQRNF